MSSRTAITKQLAHIAALYHPLLPDTLVSLSMPEVAQAFETHRMEHVKPFVVNVTVGHCALQLQYLHSKDLVLSFRFGISVVIPKLPIQRLTPEGGTAETRKRLSALYENMVHATEQLFAQGDLEIALKQLCFLLFTTFDEHRTLIASEFRS